MPDVTRRGFLMLAATAPVIPAPTSSTNLLIAKMLVNASYGKFYGGRVVYCDTDGVIEFVDGSECSFPEGMLRG